MSKTLSQTLISNSKAYIVYRFAKYFEWVIENFPYIRHYEVLNEMNLSKYFQGGKDPISTYLSILRACYPIAKKHKVKILSGGLQLEGNYIKWIDNLVSNRHLYDILAMHPYCYPKKLSKAGFAGRTIKQIHNRIKDYTKLKYDKAIDIWITEIGWPHSPDKRFNIKPEVIDETLFVDILQDLHSVGTDLGIKKTFIFSFEDDLHEKHKLYKPFGFQLKSGHLK